CTAARRPATGRRRRVAGPLARWFRVCRAPWRVAEKVLPRLPFRAARNRHPADSARRTGEPTFTTAEGVATIRALAGTRRPAIGQRSSGRLGGGAWGEKA